MRYRWWISILLLTVIGCSKSQFTQPVPVDVLLTFNTQPALNGKLQPAQLTLRPISFIVEGERSAANNISLSRDLMGTTWNLSNGASFEMDIPQGVYSTLNITFNFLGDPSFEEDISDDIDDWWEDIQNGDDAEETLFDIVDEYRNEANPSLWFEANFTHSSKGDVTAYFIIPNAWVLELLATSNSDVSLSTGTDYLSSIEFNVGQWFNQVSVGALENAYYAEGDDDDYYLFIHPKVNTTLYTLLINQIENAQGWDIP